MVTVYDMTSGTLRQELEVQKKSTPSAASADTRQDIDYLIAPALQEIALSEPGTEQSGVQHIAGLDLDNFISKMK